MCLRLLTPIARETSWDSGGESNSWCWCASFSIVVGRSGRPCWSWSTQEIEEFAGSGVLGGAIGAKMLTRWIAVFQSVRCCSNGRIIED